VDTSKLMAGDRVECNVLGNVFAATIRSRVPYRGFHVDPDNPQRISYRFVRRGQIVKKLGSGVGA